MNRFAPLDPTRSPALLALLCALIAPGACSESPGGRLDGGIRLDAPRDGATDRQVFDVPDLLVPDQRPAALDRCGGGGFLDLKSGDLTVQGSTKQLSNQYGGAIRCGGAESFAGPQRYYAANLDEEKTYRFTLSPAFDAVFYIASACGEDIINADCSSGGATGATLAVAAGQTASLIFRPRATGPYELAVDAVEATAEGDFSLRVEVFAAPAAASCQTPEVLTLQNGAASVSDTTLGARNEFGEDLDCSVGLTFDGPQRYYKVALENNKTYRLSLKADFEASLIVFGEGAGCQSADINKDCGTLLGSVLPALDKNVERSVLFIPRVDQPYIVAVDAAEATQAGTFTLKIEEVSPADNRVCDRATALTLQQGVATVQGDTSSSENDLGAHLFCGGPRLVGPQRYYSVALDAKPYRFSLSPSFDATLAIGAACNTLPIDCASAGLTGATVEVGAQKSGVVSFTPPAAGTYVVAVDADFGGAAGAFTLEVRESVAATNGSCKSPQQLVPVAGAAQISGDTGPLKNDLVGVSCSSSQGPFRGPQAYYRLSIPAGKTAEISVAPEPTFDVALYAFDATTACNGGDVDSVCGAAVSDQVGVGTVETISVPNSTAADREIIIAVDSWSPSEVGAYLLSVLLK